MKATENTLPQEVVRVSTGRVLSRPAAPRSRRTVMLFTSEFGNAAGDSPTSATAQSRAAQGGRPGSGGAMCCRHNLWRWSRCFWGNQPPDSLGRPNPVPTLPTGLPQTFLFLSRDEKKETIKMEISRKLREIKHLKITLEMSPKLNDEHNVRVKRAIMPLKVRDSESF